MDSEEIGFGLVMIMFVGAVVAGFGALDDWMHTPTDEKVSGEIIDFNITDNKYGSSHYVKLDDMKLYEISEDTYNELTVGENVTLYKTKSGFWVTA